MLVTRSAATIGAASRATPGSVLSSASMKAKSQNAFRGSPVFQVSEIASVKLGLSISTNSRLVRSNPTNCAGLRPLPNTSLVTV